jgi:hypothetical protein
MGKVINIFGEEIEFECMGCDIANHKLIPPGGYIYEDGFINISADPEIPIEGFIVLGINKHIKSINDLEDIERNKVIEILNKSIKSLKDIGLTKEVLVVQEESSKHFHIWIVPIHDWMEEYGKTIRNIDKIIEYSKENFDDEKQRSLINTIEKLKRHFK